MELPTAFDALRQAMLDDGVGPGSYAHSWHCNLAMMFHDAMRENGIDSEAAYKIGNEAASRFMKLCFDVETKN